MAVSVLFICTGNACRSQMAEAILRQLGGDRFNARSAGSDPAGFIASVAVEAMRRMGVSMEGQYSKSWDAYLDEPNDIIITLCDSAAQTPCPVWTGHPATAHWSTPDPSFIPGSDEERIANAVTVAQALRRKIQQMIALPIETMTPSELSAKLQRIAES